MRFRKKPVEVDAEENRMSKRHEFFKTRLTELGMYDEDSDCNGMIGRDVEELSGVFAEQGHSGVSAYVTRELFNKLMDEWENGGVEPVIEQEVEG